MPGRSKYSTREIACKKEASGYPGASFLHSVRVQCVYWPLMVVVALMPFLCESRLGVMRVPTWMVLSV